MSAQGIHSVWIKLIIFGFAISSTLSYENVYDLIERRNRGGFREPPFRHFASIQPFSSYYANRRNEYSPREPFINSQFGNGYDNLGNGIPVGQFHSFRPVTGRWSYEPRRSHEHGGYFPRRQSLHRYDDYPSYQYRPKFDEISNNVYGRDAFGRRTNSGSSNIDRVFQGNEDDKHEQEDEFFQRNQKGVMVDSVRREKSGEKSHADQKGENKSSLRSNKVVKKGHTTRGFASHHHKDETGNTTTFFDESSDFGGQSDFKDIADDYGTRKTIEHVSDEGNENYYNENGGRTGNYGRGYLKEKGKFEKETSSGKDAGEEGENFRRNDYEESPPSNYHHHHHHRSNGDGFDYLEPRSGNYYHHTQ